MADNDHEGYVMNEVSNIFFTESDAPDGTPFHSEEAVGYIGTIVAVKGSQAVAVLDDADEEDGASDSVRIEIGVCPNRDLIATGINR